jgi:pyrroline-5-carboxylate reductase
MEISQLQAFAEEIMHDGQGALFRCRTSGLQVDGVLDIPVNTIGEVVAVKDDQAIVVWRLEYSAFALFMMLMESYSESLVRSGSAPSAQLEKVTMVVQLLARMFEHGGKEVHLYLPVPFAAFF